MVHEPWSYRPPRKVARTAPPEACESSPLALVRTVQRTPPPPTAKVYSSPESYLSPEIGKFGGHELCSYTTEASPRCFGRNEDEKDSGMRHSLSGRFPSVSLFKEYQNAAMAVFFFLIICYCVQLFILFFKFFEFNFDTGKVFHDINQP